MREKRRRVPALAAILAAAVTTVAGCGPQAAQAGDSGTGERQTLMTGVLNGAGASFPNPLFQEWIESYGFDQPFATINYQSIGSGGGIQGFIEDTLDFGSSEKYLTDEDLATASLNRDCEAIQFPVVFGSVVIAFHDPAMDGLVLDAETIARIYDRDITRYDDPAIAALNPDRELPDREIVPVHRSDGSGTTYVFTHYLDHEVPMWAQKYSEGSDIEWAEGTVGGDGNEGVTARVINTEGGLGYVNQSYAIRHNLATARVVNASGTPIEPTLEATTIASGVAVIPENFQFDLDDIGGEGYPISGTNWIFAYECGYDDDLAELLRSFWTWAMTSEEADELALELGYAPMAPELKRRVLREIERINSR
ncbi:phosphate ABC transporter substrate-binding protein PstS [Streptomyces calidiresistens]|uniref:Phosphate-binding protein n=1 Tax=Streptomyces calidiresistens TaxID=1485586 RepID=A0A7W3XWG0_9ACTN|nr:phosphate ABC transporter substrate-binding protein PstS [Streptomyces calidiresistens]MBB0229839.1 phosphate ABC transporter substrate-binding protein PstS [Streptomyces calidiresistens]